MDLQYFGANALKISTKKSVIVVDPHSDIAPVKVDVKKATAVLVTQPVLNSEDANEAFLIDGPGEYEFEDYSVKGVAAQAYTGASGDKSATIYRVSSGDVKVLILGHVAATLTEEQLEAIGVVDVAVVPVGGGGYTLDGAGAAAIVRAIEPKLVIPVHASDDGLKYTISQAAVELFTKELGAPVAEEKPEKLRLKTLPEQLTVQLLSKS